MTKINYKSDFDFILTLQDAQGNDIGFPDFDWEARFWTFSPMQSVTASCRGGECVNCFNDGGRIHVVINAPALGCGRLRAEVVTHRENSIYPDGERTVYAPEVLDIELVNGKGNADINTNAFVRLPHGELPMIECSISRGERGNPDKLVLTNAQAYLAAGYVPVLFRKCTGNTKRIVGYDQEYGEYERANTIYHGWRSRGGMRSLKISEDNVVAVSDDGAIYNLWNGRKPSDWKWTDAITFAKPHEHYYEDTKQVVMAWGKRVVVLWSAYAEDDAEISGSFRFRFAIGFVKPFDEGTERKMLTLKDVVSNLAEFSVVCTRKGADTPMEGVMLPQTWFFSY